MSSISLLTVLNFFNGKKKEAENTRCDDACTINALV